MVGCCVLQPFAHPARATAGPTPGPHDHKPATLASATVELPAFQPGLWEYRRTVVKDDSPGPQISMLRRCADPSTEIRQQMTQLEHRSCKFAPLARRRGRYFSSWVCLTPEGPTRFRAVLIVKNASRYTHLSEMRSAQHLARQRIEAARIGECPESGPDREFR